MTTRLDRAVESLARALGWWLPLPGSKTTPAAKPGEPLGMWRRGDGRYVFCFHAVSTDEGYLGLIEFILDAPTAALALLLADVEVEVPCPECVARGGRWEWRQGTGLGPGHAGSMRVGGWTFASAPWLTDAAWGDLGWLAARSCQRCSPDREVRSLEVTVETTTGGLREVKTTDISKPGRIKLPGTRLLCEAAPRVGRHLLEIHEVGHGEWQLFDRGKPMHRPLGVTDDETVTDLLHRLCVALPSASIERDGVLVFDAWQPTVEAPHPLNATLTCIVSGDGDPQARERLSIEADRLMEAGEPRGEALALWLSGAKCPTCEDEGGVIEHRPTGPDDVQVWDPFPREQIAAHVQATQRGARAAICQPLPEECPACLGTGTALGHRLDALAEECERRARALEQAGAKPWPDTLLTGGRRAGKTAQVRAESAAEPCPDCDGTGLEHAILVEGATVTQVPEALRRACPTCTAKRS